MKKEKLETKDGNFSLFTDKELEGTVSEFRVVVVNRIIKMQLLILELKNGKNKLVSDNIRKHYNRTGNIALDGFQNVKSIDTDIEECRKLLKELTDLNDKLMFAESFIDDIKENLLEFLSDIIKENEND